MEELLELDKLENPEKYAPKEVVLGCEPKEELEM
jgi:hypothetical protein